MKHLAQMIAIGAALGGTACSLFPTERNGGSSSDPLAAAFESAPASFSSAQSSFSADADSLPRTGPEGFGFGPGGPRGPGDRGPGDRGPDQRGRGPMELGPGFGPGGIGLMGGLGPAFFGGEDGRGPGRGPFAERDTASCAYSAATGRVACNPTTRDGITVTRSMAFSTAAGVPQSAFDSATTNTVNTEITVSGTSTRGTVTRTVNHSSSRTVTGLAAGSTSRTVNGVSAGDETSTGTFRDTAFTSRRVAGDTTTGLVIPLRSGTPPYPTAGRVVRRMVVTLTRDGGSPQTSDRREVITYDGSATATLVITHNGETKTCTIALPHGRPNCG